MIYLCGPITGLSWQEAYGWRKAAREEFGEVIDPLRYDSTEFGVLHQCFTPFKTFPKRNFVDICNSKLLYANFELANQVSFGSVAEIAWAWQLRKPIVCIPGKLHDSRYLAELVDFFVADRYEAYDVIRHILAT